ncbi:MAG: hypothetical protein J0M12_03110 [Deltaproteobacteria bacterium]|nr:hypothetical protein [Deltaproteobacteria bacterium]
MSAVFVVLVILSFQIPAALGLLGLSLALDIFLTGLGAPLTWAQALAIAALLFSLPLAALLSGIFFDLFAGSKCRLRSFSLLLPVLACSLLFGSGWWMQFAEAAISVGRDTAAPSLFLLFSSVLSAVVFCAGLVTFVAMALELAFELPVRWFEGAWRARAHLALEALRPISMVIILSLAFNLIIGLCAHELWPAALAARL